MNKLIGIYGGSFDPIHHGHLNVAIEMMEAYHLDRVWFCPTSFNPLKKQKTMTSGHHRLNMVRLAIEGVPHFHVIENEAHLKEPAYTINTLESLITAHQNEQYSFALIIGEDSARDFHLWRSPEKIVSLARLLVARRGGGSEAHDPFIGSLSVVSAIERGLTQVRSMDITSTEVRQRLHHGKYCGHLVPRKVLDYISMHDLYWSL